MKRRVFLTQATQVLASAALGAAARAVWLPFPGRLAIFAQRLRDAAPFVHYDADALFPAASIIKLVILVGIVREIDERRLRWSDTFVVRRPEIVAGSESFGSAPSGSRASVRRLVDAMIAQSDNTAGNVLADHLSFSRINGVAESLGLSRTVMRRHFMDFAARARGVDNTTCAADIGALLLGIARGARGGASAVAGPQGCRAMMNVMLAQEDRETIPAGIGRHVPIANKTGVLDDVRNDAAVVDPYGDNPYVLVLLSQFNPAMTQRAYALLREDAARIDLRSR